MFGALLFLLFASYAPADEVKSSLAVDLFKDAEWQSCILECDRELTGNPNNSCLILMKTLAQMQTGADKPDELRKICSSNSAPAEIKAMANYELGRLLWRQNNLKEAFICYKTTYENVSDRDLFIRSACSLAILTSEEPKLAKDSPELKSQLQTVSSLWNNKIVAECRPPEEKRTSSKAGMPAQWVIRFYQAQISPAIGQRCTLTPSCSAYALQALKQHGLLGLSMYGDRAVREPNVVSKQESPVQINGQRKLEDTLQKHTHWLNTRKNAEPSIATPIAALIISKQLPHPTSSEQFRGTLELAITLATEKHHKESALEFRRAAGITKAKSPEIAGVCFWMAAYEYNIAHNHKLSMKMLDYAEALSNKLTSEVLLLRAEAELDARKLNESEFYLQSLIDSVENDKLKSLAIKKMAHVKILQDKPEDAQKVLSSQHATNAQTALNAIHSFKNSKTKSPTLGGTLGIMPGLGYVYSGEYANALRSLILNGLFIYGMIETADDDDWGAFSAITFFELTWFTGSIYGGVDSAHRYNETRISTCINAIIENNSFLPDVEMLPALSIKFRF